MGIPAESGRVWQVAAGDAAALQNDINHAACGDTLVLPAGSAYSGNFSIPDKSCTGWIVIQSAGVALLPSGTRVSPSQVVHMATLRSTVAGEILCNFCPARTTGGSSAWRSPPRPA